jgi:hypothetical protein
LASNTRKSSMSPVTEYAPPVNGHSYASTGVGMQMRMVVGQQALPWIDLSSGPQRFGAKHMIGDQPADFIRMACDHEMGGALDGHSVHSAELQAQ